MTAQTTTPRTLAQIAEARAQGADMLAKFIEARDASVLLRGSLTEAQNNLWVIQGSKNRMALVKGTEGRREVYRLGFISQRTIDNGVLATWADDYNGANFLEAKRIAERFTASLGQDQIVVKRLFMAIAHDIAGQDECIKLVEEAMTKLDAEELALLRAERVRREALYLDAATSVERLLALRDATIAGSGAVDEAGVVQNARAVVANAKREG